ncbi:MAG: M56 family metallopeptidase, partial [Bacteroidota bacterium]
FFGLNRYMLVAAIVIAFALPFYEIPQNWSVWEVEVSESEAEQVALTTTDLEPTAISPMETEQTPTNAALQESAINEEVTAAETTVVAPSKSFLNNISIWQVLWTVYLIGLAIFGIHFLIQLGTIVFKIMRLPSMKDGRYRIVELDKDEPPYSFLNCIFINPEKYDWDTYNQIIDHEKIHIQQFHSFDMILAELLVVLQWFNPAAWQYRKMIENNLEFLTDQSMLSQGAEREGYQLNLLKVSVPQYPIGLAMNYNQSTLKKRIKMMNAKKSSVRSSWKYLAILPALGLSTIFLNNTKALALDAKIVDPISMDQAVPDIDAKPTPDAQTVVDAQPEVETQMDQITEAVAETDFDEKVKDKLKEKEDLKWKDKSKDKDWFVEEGSTGDFDGSKGFWQAQTEAGQICVRFDNSNLRSGNMWMTTECFAKGEFDKPLQGKGTFTISRAAGKMILVGEMENDYGQGRFEFQSSTEFKNYLGKKGINDLDDKYMLHLFTADITPAYFDFLKKEGITNISRKELRDLAIHRLDMNYLQDNLPVFKQKGFNDVSVRQLVNLKIHNVSKKYIEEMASIGFDDLSIDALKKGKIHNVDAEYVKEIRGMGYTHLTFKDFVDFSIHNVDKDLVESLAKMGFKDLPAKTLKNASVHNVSARYIEELKRAGYDLKDVNDVIKFKIHNVNADFIGRMNKLGYTNLTAQEITNAAIHNVNIEDVEAMRRMGYNDMTIKQVINMTIHNVDANYVEELRSLGYKDLSIKEITNAKIHNVRPSFVKELNDLGFKNIPFKEIINLKIHNITPDFIKRAQAKGMKDLSLDEYKKLKIHGIVR